MAQPTRVADVEALGKRVAVKHDARAVEQLGVVGGLAPWCSWL